jgi:hypothetical protein
MNEFEREQDLRDLLAERATVRPEAVEPLRRLVLALPPRRRARRGLLAAAAGIVLLLGVGGLLVARLPLGTSGAAPHAPDPAAFAGDPRLAVCGATADQALAVFEMARVRDYRLHLPAAYELTGLQADPDAPALVIVFAGPASPGRGEASAGPGNHDLCMVVGADAASWAGVTIVDVDTTGLLAFLPEPTGTPIADDLAPWAERCGGLGAGILAVIRLEHGTDAARRLVLDPSPPALDTADPAAVIVYDTNHPFAPLGSPPAGATLEPREQLAEGHHDLCVLVGSDPATAARTLHEDVAVAFVDGTAASPSPSVVPGPTLPAQVDPASCDRMGFAPDRCLAIVESARTEAFLAWSDITAVSLAELPGSPADGPTPIATVTFTLRDGSVHSQDILCGGIFVYNLVCTDHPEIPLFAPYGRGGYTDVPCGATPGGEPGSACATPLPSIDPSAAAAAVPLEVAARDFPITATGHLEIEMGRATLPNGILSDARLDLADPTTRAFTVEDGIALEVRSLDPSRPPFDNVYEHGWYPGTEEVEVLLVLDVTWFTPGAQLEVRHLVVR